MCQQLFLYSATVVAHPNSSVVCWVQRINRHILCTWQTISLIIDVLVLHPTDKPDSWAKFRSQKVMKTSSPTSKRSTENSLWGWFFVCVYFFRSENNVEYLWKWHTAQWQNYLDCHFRQLFFQYRQDSRQIYDPELELPQWNG